VGSKALYIRGQADHRMALASCRHHRQSDMWTPPTPEVLSASTLHPQNELFTISQKKKWAAAVEEYADYGPLRQIYSAHPQSHQIWAVTDHNLPDQLIRQSDTEVDAVARFKLNSRLSVCGRRYSLRFGAALPLSGLLSRVLKPMSTTAFLSNCTSRPRATTVENTDHARP
jgi:hypothetical protein